MTKSNIGRLAQALVEIDKQIEKYAGSPIGKDLQRLLDDRRLIKRCITLLITPKINKNENR